MEFPFHLLPLDLQMLILSYRLDLLPLVPYLSKSFHHRSLPYLYNQFRCHPVSHHKILHHIITRWPLKWYHVEYDIRYDNVKVFGYKSNEKKYQVSWQYIFYQPDNMYHLITFPPDDVLQYLGKSELDTWLRPEGLLDLITLSQVLSQRTLCLKQDPDYIRNYLLHYLATRLQQVKTLEQKETFCMYLILNLILYGQESYPTNTSWNQEIEELIRVKYEKLVTYLQNN